MAPQARRRGPFERSLRSKRCYVREEVVMPSLALRVSLALPVLFMWAAAARSAEVALDYDYYKNRVEPIFLEKRAGHARCVMCHAESNSAFRLQRLSGKTET